MGAHVFWFTGLSGAGKSTVCDLVRRRLAGHGLRVAVLDGDDVRTRLHRHLGFTVADIRENNSLIAGLCEMERDGCDVVLVPIISPFRESRAAARRRLAPGFHEIFFDVPLEIVSRRDVKGLYGKAARGEIENMIGVAPSVPYEPPERPELTLRSDRETVAQSADRLFSYIWSVVKTPGRPDEEGVQDRSTDGVL